MHVERERKDIQQAQLVRVVSIFNELVQNNAQLTSGLIDERRRQAIWSSRSGRIGIIKETFFALLEIEKLLRVGELT